MCKTHEPVFFKQYFAYLCLNRHRVQFISHRRVDPIYYIQYVK